LIAKRLHQAAGDDFWMRAIAGYILVSCDWCWGELFKNQKFPAGAVKRAQVVMVSWIQDGDDAPKMLLGWKAKLQPKRY